MKSTNEYFVLKPASLTNLEALLGEILKTLKAKPMQDAEYYDNADLKKLLNISDSTLQRLRASKAIPFRKFRGKIFYPRSFFNKDFLL